VDLFTQLLFTQFVQREKLAGENNVVLKTAGRQLHSHNYLKAPHTISNFPDAAEHISQTWSGNLPAKATGTMKLSDPSCKMLRGYMIISLQSLSFSKYQVYIRGGVHNKINGGTFSMGFETPGEFHI